MKLKNLSELNVQEFRTFLNSFDTILCDCDGVIWKYKTALPGVKETFKTLRQHGKQINFVSNNDTVTIKVLQTDLNNCGFEVKPDEVINPNLAIIDYLKSASFNKKLFIIGSSYMKLEFKNAGFTLADSGPDVYEESVSEFSKHLHDDEDVGAVVFGIDSKLNFIKLHKAMVYLKRPEVLYLAGGSDKILPVGLPVPLIGSVYFQKPIEDILGRTPERFGKPTETFNDFMVKKLGISEASRTLFIGDSLEQDIGFAGAHGYQTLLVLTGATSFEQASKNTNEKLSPDYYIESLAELHDLVNQKINIK